MPKQSKSNFWLDLLSQLVAIFLKVPVQARTKELFTNMWFPTKKVGPYGVKATSGSLQFTNTRTKPLEKPKELLKNTRLMLLFIAVMGRLGTRLGMIDLPVPNGTCPNVVRRAFGRVVNYRERHSN